MTSKASSRGAFLRSCDPRTRQQLAGRPRAACAGLARVVALALVVAVNGGGAIAAAGSDEDLRSENAAEVEMADEAAVQEAEAAVKAAEQELQDYLGGTVTRGIVLNEERGRKLRDLRANIDAAKKRLDEAKSQ